jgi:hypothetical protein
MMRTIVVLSVFARTLLAQQSVSTEVCITAYAVVPLIGIPLYDTAV